MHYFQQRHLRDGSQFPALAGLLTIELPNKGLLSGLQLSVWGACGNSAADPDVWLHDRIKKIEVIVNGSQVVKSYDARQCLAMMLYKRTPHNTNDSRNNNAAACEEEFYINFGRWYHDLEYMIDLGQVNDPELRIEFDFAMTTAGGWSNGVAMTVAPSYDIVCHLLRDTSLIPKGYIKTSEIHRVDNAANLGYNMTVPRGPTYSNLYLQSWYASMGLGAILSKIEVNLNSDDLIPYDMSPGNMAQQVLRMYGEFCMKQNVTLTGGQAYPFPLEEGRIHYGDTGLVASVMQIMDLWGNFAAPGFKDIAAGLTPFVGQVNVGMDIRGTRPFSVSPIPLLEPWDPDTWIDTSILGDFWVRIEENAGGTAGVMKLLGDEVVTKYTTPSWP